MSEAGGGDRTEVLSPQEAHPIQAAVQFARAVRRRKTVVLGALGLSLVLGALYYALAPRWYQSEASLLVLQSGEDTWSTRLSGERAARDLMATYRNMLSSAAVLEKAIEGLPAEGRSELAGLPQREWPGRLARQLSVRNVRGTNVLELAYVSQNPQSAAAVLEAVIGAYLAFMDSLHRSTSQELLDILTREKSSLERQLQKREAELLELRRRAGEVVLRDGQEGVNVAVKRAMSLNQALIAAHEKRIEAQARQATLEGAIRRGDDLQPHALAMMDSAGRELLLQRLGISQYDALAVSRVVEQLVESRARLAVELETYGPAHPRPRETQQRIRAAEEYLSSRQAALRARVEQLDRDELAALLQQMASQQVEQALAQEQAVLASYEQEKESAIRLDQAMAELEILQLDLNRLRGFYDVVLQRIKDIDLGRESGVIRTAVLRRPEVPDRPTWPRASAVGLLVLVLGVAGGLGVVYVQELLDDRFRTPEELQERLRVPVLAVVGRLEPVESGCGAESIHVVHRPEAPHAEPFRTLRTALGLLAGGAERVVVSSPEPGDGKTTIAVNLAAVYAQSGKRTLLIDADLRHPGLSALLGLRKRPGLSNVLADHQPTAVTAEACVYANLAPLLDVLPAGPRVIQAQELVERPRLAELLAWAETRYDQVIIDSPPMVVSDAVILGRAADGVVLAIQPAKNRRRMVLRTVSAFTAFDVPILGVVLNHLTADEDEAYGYGYGYPYGYPHHAGAEEDTHETSWVRPHPAGVSTSAKAA